MERLNGVQTVGTVVNSGWTESQRESILAESNRLVGDPLFNRSQRCVVLLRSLIGHALDGDSNIKERTLGVEVFGRSANYDTNMDPIVRMTANEIRKRLAQYYQNADHKRAVIIHIESGNYIPSFEFLRGNPQAEEQADGEKSLGQSSKHDAGQNTKNERDSDKAGKATLSILGRKRAWILIILVLSAAVAFTLNRHWLHPSSQFLIWKPMLKANEPLVICVSDNPILQGGEQTRTAEEQAAQTQIFADMAESRKAPETSDLAKHHSMIPFEDARAAQLIARWLAERGRDTTLQQASSLTFRDFHRERVMMIGGFDNPWSVVLLTGMRYSFRADPAAGALWIKDAQNPAKRDWIRSDKATSSDIDYAIIASFYDEELKNRIMVVGGLGEHGTEAAARLLLDSSLDGQIPLSVRSANNFEIVIRTYQVNGETAPPQIVAAYTW